MGKYNLLVGSNYEKFVFDEPYVATDYDDMYNYLYSLSSFRDKLKEGYVLEYTFNFYDSTNSVYTLTGALLSHNLEYKTGTVLCESDFVCTKDELLYLAKEQGYFDEEDTSFYFIDSSDDTGVIALEFTYYDNEYYLYTYHIFDEPVASITEALADSEVRKKLTNDSSFEFITLSFIFSIMSPFKIPDLYPLEVFSSSNPATNTPLILRLIPTHWPPKLTKTPS